MPPCTVGHRVNFTLAWEAADGGLVSFGAEGRGLVRCLWTSIPAQALLRLLLCLCAGGKGLDGGSLENLIQCCGMFLTQFVPSCFIFWRPPLLLSSPACVGGRFGGVTYSIGFHVEDQGALLTWILDSVAQEFLVAWLVIRAHRLAAQSVMSKMILTTLQPDCFKGGTVP